MEKINRANTIIRVQPDVYEELTHLVKMTRRPIGEITSEALRYALDNSHMVQVKAYDVVFGECRRKDTEK